MTDKQQSADPLDENAWVEAALVLLAEGSIHKVGVEPLAKQLGVTKGSFYWHFKDRAALHDGMLRAWKRRATLAIIERLEHGAVSTVDRLQQMIDLPYHSPKSFAAARVELAIRAWARSDKRAANAVAEVDEQRLTYLTGLFRRIGYDELDASVRAYLVYSYMISESLIVTGSTQNNQKMLDARRARAREILIGTAAPRAS